MWPPECFQRYSNFFHDTCIVPILIQKQIVKTVSIFTTSHSRQCVKSNLGLGGKKQKAARVHIQDTTEMLSQHSVDVRPGSRTAGLLLCNQVSTEVFKGSGHYW